MMIGVVRPPSVPIHRLQRNGILASRANRASEPLMHVHGRGTRLGRRLRRTVRPVAAPPLVVDKVRRRHVRVGKTEADFVQRPLHHWLEEWGRRRNYGNQLLEGCPCGDGICQGPGVAGTTKLFDERRLDNGCHTGKHAKRHEEANEHLFLERPPQLPEEQRRSQRQQNICRNVDCRAHIGGNQDAARGRAVPVASHYNVHIPRGFERSTLKQDEECVADAVGALDGNDEDENGLPPDYVGLDVENHHGNGRLDEGHGDAPDGNGEKRVLARPEPLGFRQETRRRVHLRKQKSKVDECHHLLVLADESWEQV